MLRNCRRALAALVIALTAFLVYAPSITNDNYFSGDDFGLIHTLHDKPLGFFLTCFYGDWTGGLYGNTLDELRPWLAFSYKLDSDLWGGSNPWGFHLSNVLLHVLCSLLVFGTVRALSDGLTGVGLLAGLFFAVAPCHAEPVIWISGRVDSIAGVFYLSAFLFFVLFRARRSWWYYGLSLAAFTLGLFAKQSLIPLPFLLLAYDVCYGHGRRAGGLAARHAPFMVVLFLYLFLRYVTFGHAVREDTMEALFVWYFSTRQVFYLQALLLPSSLLHYGWFTQALLAALVTGVLGTRLIGLWRDRRARGEALRHVFFSGWCGMA